MKKLLSIIGFPLLFVVSQFFMTLIATVIFIVSHHISLEWIGTEEYIKELSGFLSKYNIILVLFSFIIFCPLFYKVFQKENEFKKRKITLLDGSFLILLGISFSLLYNSILGCLNTIFPITNLFDGGNSIFFLLISSVLLGPILEEFLFRGIVYHRLQKQYPIMKSLLLTGVIFALSHTNFFQIIYAFIFNFMLIFAFERFSLKASIIVHMSSNVTSLLFTLFIYPNIGLMQLSIVIGSILLSGSYLLLKGNKIEDYKK